MIKDIVTDTKVLSVKCNPCYFDDFGQLKLNEIQEDLEDTVRKHLPECAGLAANQIGYDKRMIIVNISGKFAIMLNPNYVPIRMCGTKRSKETCLSFPDRNGVNVKRYKKIKLTYQTISGLNKQVTLTKDNSIRVQHEIDHLNGKLI